MLNAWFMFDNHTFARIDVGDIVSMIKRVQCLFEKDGHGTLFVRDGDAFMESLTRHGHNGMPLADITAWARAVLAEESFHRTMAS